MSSPIRTKPEPSIIHIKNGAELPTSVKLRTYSHQTPEDACNSFRMKYQLEPGRVFVLDKLVLIEVLEPEINELEFDLK